MSVIPQPYADGQPYVLKVGDRINYFVTMHAIQIYSNHGPASVEFFEASSASVPRFVLPRSIGKQNITDLLNEFLKEQQVVGVIEQVESTWPSVETFEVKALS